MNVGCRILAQNKISASDSKTPAILLLSCLCFGILISVYRHRNPLVGLSIFKAKSDLFLSILASDLERRIRFYKLCIFACSFITFGYVESLGLIGSLIVDILVLQYLRPGKKQIFFKTWQFFFQNNCNCITFEKSPFIFPIISLSNFR